MRFKFLKKYRHLRAFTLVELLVVISIIGILSTLVIIQLRRARERTKDTLRISHISQIKSAIEFYNDDFGSYPQETMYHASIQPDLIKYFSIPIIPRDPSDFAQYGYTHNDDPFHLDLIGFWIWAELETGSAALMNDATFNPALFDNGHSSGRLSTIPTPPNDPNAGSCPDNNLSNRNCIYDAGVTP